MTRAQNATGLHGDDSAGSERIDGGVLFAAPVGSVSTPRVQKTPTRARREVHQPAFVLAEVAAPSTALRPRELSGCGRAFWDT